MVWEGWIYKIGFGHKWELSDDYFGNYACYIYTYGRETMGRETFLTEVCVAASHFLQKTLPPRDARCFAFTKVVHERGEQVEINDVDFAALQVFLATRGTVVAL